MRTLFHSFTVISLSALFYTVNAAPQLLAYWSFDSSSGNTYYDVTGHGYDASGTGSGFGLVPGVVGQALNCSGNGYEITVANSANDFYLSTFTVECWFYSNVNPSQNSEEGKILDYSYITSGTRNGFTVDMEPTGQIRLVITNPDGSEWVEAWTSSLFIQAAKWYHIVCTYDNAYCRIYVNGVLNVSRPYQGRYLAPNNNAHIGYQERSTGSNMYYLNGRIDELKLYNYALPADSILAHYNAIIPSSPPLPPSSQCSLIAHWSFDSSLGNTYYDVTGHGYDAIATGTGVGLTRGVKCQALNCSGNGYEITVANSASDFYLSKFSIECWLYSNVNPSQNSSEGKILDYSYITNGTRNGFTVDLYPSGIIRFIIPNDDGSLWMECNSSTPVIQAATWYHIACTYDSACLRIYINGVLSGSRAYQGIYPNPYNLAHIGYQERSNGDNMYYLNGRIDELKLYRNALPVDSILEHYNAPKGYVPMIIHCPTHTCDRRPTCKWYPRPKTGCYSIQINNTPDFVAPLIADEIDDTAYAPIFDLPLGSIFWRVGSTAPDQSGYSYPDTFTIEPATGISGSNPENTLSATMSIVQLRRGMAVNYSLEKQSAVSFDIFTINGTRIVTVYRGSAPTGNHSITWDGTGKGGKVMPAGSYLAVFKINERTFTKVIMLMR
jgi:hypothetical protein